MPRFIPILAALIILSVIADPKRPVTAQDNDPAVIHGLVSRYVDCFNARNAECILDLYANRARIKKEDLFDDEWVGVDRYAAKLQQKLDEYEERGARITRYDIEDLRMRERRADLVVSVTAEQGVFSKDFSGSFRLAQTSQGWRIICDEF